MNPFETETMADLCLRQGHRQEALAIYRRLLARVTAEPARARIIERISAIDNVSADGAPLAARSPTGVGTAPLTSPVAAPATLPARPASAPPIPLPGVRARHSGDQLTIEWRLPVETRTPALEVLLVKTGPGGVSTETRELALAGNAGLLTLVAKGLHSVRVAAGSRGPRGFVPLARG